MSMPPSAEAPGASSPQLAAIGDADPLQDLRVTHASLEKDYTGTKAVWKVRVQNKSSVCTYTDIEYEASYIAADDAVLALSQGTIEADVEPSEEKQISDLEDILFPVGTVRYEFRLTGAKATVR
jgi:hypothetical protein